MPNMGVTLTDSQRERLEILAELDGRSMSNLIGRLIDFEFESHLAYMEKENADNGAQNPEPEPTV